ncbi:MAG: hypothetical protein AB8F34_12855 [Akkermansiaceae bacterium]
MNSSITSIFKKKIALIFASAVLSCTAASADSFATLAGAGDSIIIRKGETALVMSGAGVLTYGRLGKPCAFIRLSNNQNHTVREISNTVLPLMGPCKITVRSQDGFVGMRIVASGTRPVTEAQAVASIPSVKSAVNP